MYEELDAVIRREIECGGLTGLAVGLVRGDELVWTRGYGVADRETNEPVTPSTLFSIQSVTKPVLATALLQQYERGRFQLDEPVAPHLAPIVLQNEWEANSPVTFRGLLTHTAGFPVDLGGGAGGNAATLEDFVAPIAKTVRRPGEDIVYANYGYDIIGLLIERFAGKPFAQALGEQVIEPLGMRSTYISRPPDGVRHARGYYLSAIDGTQHAVPHDYEESSAWPRPAGVLLSTVEDMARFLIAHVSNGMYAGHRVLRPETIAEMHRLHARHGAATNGMGLGFKVDESSCGHVIYHGGDGVGFTVFIAASPQERAGVVLLMNTGRAHTARSVIGNTALRCLTGAAAPPAQQRVHDGAGRIAGRYVSNFWGYIADASEVDGELSIQVVGGGLTAGGERPSVLTPADDGVYRAHGGFFDGFDLAFVFGPHENAVSFAGGLYAFRFDRQGDVPPEDAIDKAADLAGSWSGAVTSPMGPVPIEIEVAESVATVTVLSAQNAAVERVSIGRGHLDGQFDVSVPGLGEFVVYLRLYASGGELRGNAYAQGVFGEIAMPAELARS